MSTSRHRFMEIVGGVCLVLLGLNRMALMVLDWRGGNPPLAIFHGLLMFFSFIGALILFVPKGEISAPGEAWRPPKRGAVARAIDRAPISFRILVGAGLFITGAAGLITSTLWNLEFALFGVSCGVGFYLIRHALTLRGA